MSKGDTIYLNNIVKFSTVIPKLLNIYLLKDGKIKNKQRKIKGRSIKLLGICSVVPNTETILIKDKNITTLL